VHVINQLRLGRRDALGRLSIAARTADRRTAGCSANECRRAQAGPAAQRSAPSKTKMCGRELRWDMAVSRFIRNDLRGGGGGGGGVAACRQRLQRVVEVVGCSESSRIRLHNGAKQPPTHQSAPARPPLIHLVVGG